MWEDGHYSMMLQVLVTVVSAIFQLFLALRIQEARQLFAPVSMLRTQSPSAQPSRSYIDRASGYTLTSEK